MAIYHCSMKPLSRGGGRSAVAAIAYRAAEKLLNERDGMLHDFTRRQGVEHTQIVLPEGIHADWAMDRSSLWNSAEKSERRCDARVAREFEIALPHELNDGQRLELCQSFSQALANRYGTAVDFAIHHPYGDSDIRNIHAHVMMTTRSVHDTGFGDKTILERENKWLLNRNLPTTQMQLRAIRQSLEEITNLHLARAGLDLRVDHRSHQDRGLEIVPTSHVGVHASQMDQRGMDVSRVRLDRQDGALNADLIREKPEQILTLITQEKSVFDRHDIARALHRYLNDDVETFRNVFARVMTCDTLVALERPDRDDNTRNTELTRYSTKEMIALETAMLANALQLHKNQDCVVDRRHVETAIDRQNSGLRDQATVTYEKRFQDGQISVEERHDLIESARLSDEQCAAIRHITGQERLSVVVGFAGAGKSTMLDAARRAFEAQGYRVRGAALSGKAAEGLEQSSGISSRTLASWEASWKRSQLIREQNGGHSFPRETDIGSRDVFIIDEAGMIGSRQMARFVAKASEAGVKLILVGDHEQLQAIGAGAPFRALSERTGFALLSEIRRQQTVWQAQASVSFASHLTNEGLSAYQSHGAIRFCADAQQTRDHLIRDYITDREQNPEGSRVAMAHRRIDVHALNAEIRNSLQERGLLPKGEGEHRASGLDTRSENNSVRPENSELAFETIHGKRHFVEGDRIVFLENNRDLHVKNGMLGTVEAVKSGELYVRADGKTDRIRIANADYKAFDHGYATTIHKTQGATVDRAFVYASQTMDRHLTYFAMTRHRDSAALYVDRTQMKSMEVLSEVLSRSGQKETTLDYKLGASSIADKNDRDTHRLADKALQSSRTISDPGNVQVGRNHQMSAPETGPSVRHVKAPLLDRLAERLRFKTPFEKALDHYARVWVAADQLRQDGLPILESQKHALIKAGADMERHMPQSQTMLESALRHNPDMTRVMHEVAGHDRIKQLTEGVRIEMKLAPEREVERALQHKRSESHSYGLG